MTTKKVTKKKVIKNYKELFNSWLVELLHEKGVKKCVKVKEDSKDRYLIHLYTDSHCYSISATPTYLGCIASTTYYEPGRDHTLGNDLPDGRFCRETWNEIKDAILRYEIRSLISSNLHWDIERLKDNSKYYTETN